MAVSFNERVLAIADIMSCGQWRGHPTVSWLSGLWNVDGGTVLNYRRAAAVVCEKDRGDTSQLLEDTLAALLREEEHYGNMATSLEQIGEYQAAARYRELEHKARAKHAEVAGLIQTKIQHSIEGDPRIAGVFATVYAALEQLDAKREAFLTEVQALTGGVLPTAELPGAEAFVRAAVREYQRDVGARKGLAA